MRGSVDDSEIQNGGLIVLWCIDSHVGPSGPLYAVPRMGISNSSHKQINKMQIRLGCSTALGEAKRQDFNNRFLTRFAMSRDLIPAPPRLPLPRFPSPLAVCIFILPGAFCGSISIFYLFPSGQLATICNNCVCVSVLHFLSPLGSDRSDLRPFHSW